MAGKLVIFSAPSGAGKTTIVKRLLERKLSLEFSISATTRERRPNESYGKDYYFLSVEDFKSKIENNELTIYYQYTRSNQSYTFEWKNNQMLIKEAESNGVHSATGNYKFDSLNFKKGEIITRAGNISEEGEKNKIIKFSAKPKSLSEFGYMYDWKIIEHKFL